MKTNRTLFEQIGGTYTQAGDFLLPDLDVEECEPIGKYGRIRKRYLKEQRPIAEINRTCNERMELIIQQMKKREEVTERLKAGNQWAWIQGMNDIQNRAEEIVLSELVYCWNAKVMLEKLAVDDMKGIW